MIRHWLVASALAAAFGSNGAAQQSSTKLHDDQEHAMDGTSALDFTIDSIDGEPVQLGKYRGKVVLMVNVASRCGLTPQYKGLQALYERFGDQGLVVLGFPCNQFLGQEPGNAAEIKQFCQTRYHVTFPLFSKIKVNGDGRDPLYRYLTAQKTQPTGPGDISWNFEKFLIDRNGAVVARFSPRTKPEDTKVVQAIESALRSSVPKGG